MLMIESFHFVDPRGRPTVTAGSDHCFRAYCPSVHTSPLSKSITTKQISRENIVLYC